MFAPRAILFALVFGWVVGATVSGLAVRDASAACSDVDHREDAAGADNNWNDVALDGVQNNDYWEGKGGQDTLESLPCSESFGVFGNNDNDDIHLGSGYDNGFGAAGRDDIWGGQGDDTLGGGNGDDELFDAEGGDQDDLDGNTDNDYLDVQDIDTTADTADGGPDSDTCPHDIYDSVFSC